MSIQEVVIVSHFGDSGQLNNRPSDVWWISDRYDGARIARDLNGSASWWWLRSPGFDPNIAAVVYYNGDLFLTGNTVFWSGGVGGGVRPALWLRLE